MTYSFTGLKAEIEDFSKLVEVLFPFPNLCGFESISNVCLLRNTASSFSHPGGAGPVPTRPYEVMSSGVTEFSVSPPWRQNLTAGGLTNRQGKENTWGSVAQDERGAGMANSTGDLETGKDMDDLTKGLEELCDISKERREKALLLLHLEQQHHLMSMLTKKADDTQKLCRALEQLNMELEKLRTEAALKIKTQTLQIQHLEGRFMDPANNHEKMIQFKNEHRKQHMQLWEENKHLRQEKEVLFSQAVREKEAEVLRLAAQARKLSQQLYSLQEKHTYESCRAQEREKELLEAQSHQAGAYTREMDSLKKQLQLLQERHQQAVARAEQAESQQRAQSTELWAELERAHKEKEQLLNLARERGKALQDKEREIQQLGEKLEVAEEAMLRAGRCYEKEAAAVDKDLKVQQLQGQLESSKQAYNELSLRIDAYRKHSMDLLTKERTLNVKLCHFVA
ncbi:coiled-coil domain-containing protein 89 isoform X2 [Pipra filicauda]|uniref:Coiled-coil domain-containing protein 89 isoform X2 n=1 Tax=Pipra filicauda TaxID=649802 RepID=A0A6J2GKC4_9PASS|nr:coiled-coil domain-containing protein 89 isoform X2 [Pipra filicauda]